MSTGSCLGVRSLFPAGYCASLLALIFFVTHILYSSNECKRISPRVYVRNRHRFQLPCLFFLAILGLCCMASSMLLWRLYCSIQWIENMAIFAGSSWRPLVRLHEYWWFMFFLVICSMLFAVIAFYMNHTMKQLTTPHNTHEHMRLTVEQSDPV